MSTFYSTNAIHNHYDFGTPTITSSIFTTNTKLSTYSITYINNNNKLHFIHMNNTRHINFFYQLSIFINFLILTYVTVDVSYFNWVHIKSFN